MSAATILVVDDRSEDADLLATILQTAFPLATLCVAYGGKEALDAAALRPPDVALVDLEMPFIDGVEVGFALRTALPAGSPLIVGLSGNVLRLSSLKHKSPFDHRMVKPIDIEALIDIVSGHLADKEGV
ncbi:response regulator [Delftia acidovorans]|uniref:response regulator n=1 Tax=Delftia acidovorans TaxID=80866 RepID=UPI0030197BCB